MAEVLALGTLLDGRFKITRVMTQNPYRVVYQVFDTKITEKNYAAVEYFPSAASLEERYAIEKTFRETAEKLKTFQHPHLVRVFEFFVEGNRPYLITELVEGLSLTDLVNIDSEPPPESQLLNWFSQLAEALDYLHNLSTPFYVKNLNPAHIVTDRDGGVKIGGYGVELLFAVRQNQTQAYLAPECSAVSNGSAAADVYAFGAACYFLASRKSPAPDPEPLSEINPKISQKTSELIGSCLHLKPELRPDNLGEIRGEIHELLFPPQPVVEHRASKPRVSVVQKLKESLPGIIEFIGTGLIEGIRRPFYIALIALVAWVFYVNFHPFALKKFHKSGPLLYVGCKYGLFVIDPVSLKVVDQISAVEQAHLGFASSNGNEILLATPRGLLYEISLQNDSVLSKFSLGQEIGGIAPGKNQLFYATLKNDNTVAAFLASTHQMIAIAPVGREPKNIAYNESQKEIYLTTAQLKSIFILDSEKFAVRESFPTDSVPDQIAQSPDGSYLYVLYNGLSRIDIFKTGSKERISSIEIESAGPYWMNPYEQGLLILAYRGNQVLLYDSPSGKKRAQVSFNKPKLALFSPELNRIFALNASGYLYSLNPSSGQTLNHARTSWLPSLILLVP